MYCGDEFNKEIITRERRKDLSQGKNYTIGEFLSYKIPLILGLFYRKFSIYETDCHSNLVDQPLK